MIEYRDRVAKELGIKLIVQTNWDAVKMGSSLALGRLEDYVFEKIPLGTVAALGLR